MPVVGARAQGRNRSFDLLRILFAVVVLCGHAPELTDGDRSRELFTRISHSRMSLGDVAVVGFFLLSGYLIVRSWQGDPDFLNFLVKRSLRIAPGFIVAMTLGVLSMGLLAPAVPDYFHQLIYNICHHAEHITPPVLPGNAYPIINGSIWSIATEFRCYLVVAIFGVFGLLRRPAIWFATTVLLVAAAVPESTLERIHLPHLITLIVGEPSNSIRWIAVFFIGGCFFFFRKSIPFKLPLFLLALALLVVADIIKPYYLFLPFALCGAYIMFYLAQLPALSRIRAEHLPDISYGIYLYGWPVESLWIYYHRGSPWTTLLASTILCIVLGWISWHYIERPMLSLKRKSTAALPPA